MMAKREMDVQLIEACILERWNPLAMGCKIEGVDAESCCLCQIYIRDHVSCCINCPVFQCTGYRGCDNTPFDYYAKAIPGSPEELDGIEAEIEFLISLLPEDHPWRIEE